MTAWAQKQLFWTKTAAGLGDPRPIVLGARGLGGGHLAGTARGGGTVRTAGGWGKGARGTCPSDVPYCCSALNDLICNGYIFICVVNSIQF